MDRAMRTSTRVSVVAVLGAALLAVATAAQAHVEASPEKVKAETTAVISFHVPHGCAGSPTTSITIRLPLGVGTATPIAKVGWRTSLNGRVITFGGGSLPANTGSVFSIRATMPATSATLAFPTKIGRAHV